MSKQYLTTQQVLNMYLEGFDEEVKKVRVILSDPTYLNDSTTEYCDALNDMKFEIDRIWSLKRHMISVNVED